MATPASGPVRALAGRLRDLRETRFPDVRITQSALGDALGGASAPLISSWETGSATPSRRRVFAYATFFATERSVEGGKLRLLREGELTPSERAARDDLKRELMSLRADVSRAAASQPDLRSALGGLWHFRDGRPVRIVSPEVPPEQRKGATPEDPTLAYGELYAFASIDALVELFGHIRAANPRSDVRIIKESQLQPDDYAAHLVTLGGVDWNALSARTPTLLPDFPIRQTSPGDDPGKSYFQVGEGDNCARFGPELGPDGKILSDAGLFLRAPSPYNRKRTFTMCSAAYGLGTFGVVRALTDANFRDRNEEYVRERFPRAEAFSILSRILVLDGHEALTPDWSAPTTVLHEWPEA